MALTEAEELELLTLQKQRAMSRDTGANASQMANAAAGGLIRGGVAGTLGLPVDTVANVLNLGIAGVGAATGTTPSLINKPVGGSEWIAEKLQNLGVNTRNPRPYDPASRMLYTGGTIAGGMLPFTGGQGAVRGITATLPSATAGAVAGEALGPEWIGPASMAPAAVAQGAGALKQSIAGNAAQNAQSFREAGSNASVGQATENSFLRGLENLISKFPGGSGVMAKFSAEQQKQLGDTTKTGVPTEAAGRAIETGIKGAGGFLERTKNTWTALDNEVAQKIPPTTAFAPTNTVQALDKLTTPVTGATKTTQALINPAISDLQKNVAADLKANNGMMPYEALRAVRSKIGSMLDTALVSGIPGGELKQIYGALTKDMEAAANQAGAGREFKRQNDYYRARMDRVESVLERVIGKGKQPEDIFKSFYPTDPDQANKVRAVMRSLAPDERQIVTDAAVNKLGRVAPGRQDEIGSVFSSETFLTNWNKLSSGAKAQLFPDVTLRLNLDHLAKAAENIRTGSKVFQNTSGTAGSFAAYSVYASPIAAVATGSLAPLLAAGGAAGSAYIGAKMLTNPAVVEWLAKAPTLKPGMEAAHLAKLGVIYNKTNDPELKAELTKFMDVASNSIAAK